ncbi:MAG TPA: gliding motility lipoprotein GldD [Bacteroidales bacterium]|nr:gliding motility lipoprotein GldD [Bacteroidales bacterium]HRZ76575.1 gliding motility lipoprotein GldD [Bacteroidales bacterium]
MIRTKGRVWVGIIAGTLLLGSCGSEPVPRPRGYFRIDMPQRAYLSFDTTWPYAFEYPVYARVQPDRDAGAEPYWADLFIPEFGARIHLSYKRMQGDLSPYAEDARKMAMQHIARSTGIQEIMVARPEAGVYGIIYQIEGREAASPLQFYLTDSSTHFLRGALYFNQAPNNDSLAPVIAFLQEDLLHLVETMHWK